MDFSNWTDEEILRTRERLLEGYMSRGRGNWKDRAFTIAAILAFITFPMAFVDLLRGGLSPMNLLFMTFGVVISYIWHRNDKAAEGQVQFMTELNGELVRRGHKL